jgi:hypothetical protein
VEKRLYVGLDESNNGRKPLIVAAYFTTDPTQARFRRRYLDAHEDVHSLRPNYAEIIDLLKTKASFLFIEDDKGRLGESGKQLVLAAPILVRSFMRTAREKFSGLGILLDGPMNREDKDFVRREIIATSEFETEDISIEGVVKPCRKRNTTRVCISYPDILITSDGIAHALYAYPGLRNKQREKGKEVLMP